MNDKIYELLNKCAEDTIDDTEKLTKQEVNSIMTRFRNDNKMNDTGKRRRKPGIVLFISAVTAACIGTSAVYAYERLSSFNKLKNNADRTITANDGSEIPIVKEDRNNYEALESAAEILEAPAAAENENITLSVDTVYCDGQSLVAGITGSLNDGNPAGYGYIDLNSFYLEIDGKVCAYAAGLSEIGGYMVIDEDSENSFTGSIKCIFDGDRMLTETADVKVSFMDMICREKYYTNGDSIGKGEVEFTVTPDLSNTRSIGRSFTEDGFTFTVHDITPAMMTASYTFPEEYICSPEDETTIITFYDENGETCYMPKYSIIAMVYDEYGNRLDRVLDQPVITADGISANTYAAPPTDIITVKFCNKQESDSSGMPIVLKEMTIGLSE